MSTNATPATALFSVIVPSGWTQDELPGGALRVRPDGASGALAPTFTVEQRRGDVALSLPELRLSHAADLADGLVDPRVLDSGLSSLEAAETHVVLLSHRVDGLDVTLEQWAIARGRRTILITVSAATLDYAALAPDFHELAESLAIHA